MSDIVARLRRVQGDNEDAREAADKIERLRAAHQEIRDLENNKIVSGEGLFMRALLIARRALK